MVTTRLAELALRLTTRRGYSQDVQELVDRYAPRNAEIERQLLELSLVVACAVATFAVVVVTAILGLLIEPRDASRSAAIYAGIVAVPLSGLILHLVRYYDAWFGKTLTRQRSDLQWPRRSGDLDLIVQVVAGLAVGMALASR